MPPNVLVLLDPDTVYIVHVVSMSPADINVVVLVVLVLQVTD